MKAMTMKAETRLKMLTFRNDHRNEIVEKIYCRRDRARLADGEDE